MSIIGNAICGNTSIKLLCKYMYSGWVLQTVYVDEDGFPISLEEGRSKKKGHRKKTADYPTDDLDDRHLYAVRKLANHLS